jgi:hypothetical protein
MTTEAGAPLAAKSNSLAWTNKTDAGAGCYFTNTGSEAAFPEHTVEAIGPQPRPGEIRCSKVLSR